MKDSRTFFLLNFIDLQSIPSVSRGLFLLPFPILNSFFREGVCQAFKGGPGLRKSFQGLLELFESIRARIAMFEIVIHSQRCNEGNHSPIPTSFFQLESLMWSS